MGKTPSLLAFALLLLPTLALAQGTTPQTPESREAQYVALQADLYDTQSLAALPEPVSDIERMLREIRSQFPLVAELRVPAQLTAGTSLIVGLQPAFRPQVDRLCASWSGYARARSATIEIAALDALTRQFGGGYEITCQSRGLSFGSYVVVNFSRLLHVPSLARLFRAVAGVTSADSNRVALGGVMPVAVKRDGAQWRVTFGHGAGDCPAGCTYREYHRFLVAADFTIQFLGTEQQGELPSAVPQEEPEEEPLPQ